MRRSSFGRVTTPIWGLVWVLLGCAAPALSLYSLDSPRATFAPGALGSRPLVIEIARVSLPDEIDTEDLILRDGTRLIRSSTGRWGSRLSLEITDVLTGRLAARRSDALVTDQPQPGAATWRVQINISRLDIALDGTATLDADWLMLPHDPSASLLRGRSRFTASGAVATDAAAVALTSVVLDKLAAAIDISGLR